MGRANRLWNFAQFLGRFAARRVLDGLGRKLRFVPELIVADPEKSVREGALKPWREARMTSSSMRLGAPEARQKAT